MNREGNTPALPGLTLSREAVNNNSVKCQVQRGVIRGKEQVEEESRAARTQGGLAEKVIPVLRDREVGSTLGGTGCGGVCLWARG